MNEATPPSSFTTKTTAAGTQPPTGHVENPAEPPKRPPTVLEQWGGTSGMIYMTLPVVAFVVGNSVAGLYGAIIAAVVVAVGVTVVRIARKESIQPALNGLSGVAVAAGVSLWTGSAKDYFLLGIWLSLAGAVVLVLSVLVRRPLAGLAWNAITGKGQAWRRDPKSRLYYDIATLALAAVFAARFVVQQWLYDSDETGWLGFAKIAMGYPLLALALLVVAWAARRSARRLDALAEAGADPQTPVTPVTPAANRSAETPARRA